MMNIKRFRKWLEYNNYSWPIMKPILLCSCILLILYGVCSYKIFNEYDLLSDRSFKVDYKGNNFMLDGKPFKYISGSIHYFRIPRYYWYDRLMKVKALGLNAIQFYIPWNYHEYEEGQYDFSGEKDVIEFIKVAQKVGLYVLLRPGGYICGEWDFGGLPAWLLRKNQHMALRSSKGEYMSYLSNWYKKLLPMLKPYLYVNGGNIIMVQVENEYGSFGCDRAYISGLTDLFKNILGNDILLYSTDGYWQSYFTCGSSDRRLFTTVDFGTGSSYNIKSTFSALEHFQPNGPLVNSEYYTGWIDAWFNRKSFVSGAAVASGLSNMINYQTKNVSVNMYMIHGGTSFGFWNGANAGPVPQTTSYDYNAPITEAGDITNKYMMIRDVIQKNFPNELLPPIPANTSKSNYGTVLLNWHSNFLPNLLLNSKKTLYKDPLYMEALYHYQGYMIYEVEIDNTIFKYSSSALLAFVKIKDNAYIFSSNNDYTDIEYQGTLGSTLSMNVNVKNRLIVVIENVGHINYGSAMINDVKGIVGAVTLNKTELKNWHHIPLGAKEIIEQASKIGYSYSDNTNSKLPTQSTLYTGNLFINPKSCPTNDFQCLNDTYVKIEGLQKGIIIINGFNLGRYYPIAGPQITLFVPKTVLLPGLNKIIVYDLNGKDNNNTNAVSVTFQDKPEWGKSITLDYVILKM